VVTLQHDTFCFCAKPHEPLRCFSLHLSHRLRLLCSPLHDRRVLRRLTSDHTLSEWQALMKCGFEGWGGYG
jgi:hypothetical protein